MPYHPRIESKELCSFLTSKCRNSELWFANNPAVEGAILGYAAKYAQRYGAKLYALAIEGNHIQAPALFPNGNRKDFMRDFNSQTALAVSRLTPNYPGGRLFYRRYSNEFVPGRDDIEEYFFYTVLQPIQDCLIPKLSEYPFYNCFSDAVKGIEREVKVVNWSAYYAKRRYNKAVFVKDFTETYKLKYERIPGYEELSQKEYSKLMHEKYETRRAKLVRELLAQGKRFLGREALLKTVPGTPIRNPKKSTRETHRPRILSICPQRRAEYKSWYFELYFAYKAASRKFRSGILTTIFPPGMYPPHLPCKLSP